MLREAGLTVFAEVARRVIVRERDRRPHVLPWNDRRHFDRLIIEEMIKDYQAATCNSVNFFDRALPELIGWARFAGIEEGAYAPVVKEHPYEKSVFFLTPDAKTYVQNDDRPYSFEESMTIATRLREGYVDFGYQIVEVDFDEPRRMAASILRRAQDLVRAE